jgi:hypothetical protein
MAYGLWLMGFIYTPYAISHMRIARLASEIFLSSY